MAKRRWQRVLAMLVLATVPPGCGRLGGGGGVDAERPMLLTFEDMPAPGAFATEGPAVRDAEGGADGLWATVAGLPRPERARITNPETGETVVVALFRGRAGEPIRVSNEAAGALGIGGEPVRVDVTALRSRPSIGTTEGRF